VTAESADLTPSTIALFSPLRTALSARHGNRPLHFIAVVVTRFLALGFVLPAAWGIGHLSINLLPKLFTWSEQLGQGVLGPESIQSILGLTQSDSVSDTPFVTSKLDFGISLPRPTLRLRDQINCYGSKHRRGLTSLDKIPWTQFPWDLVYLTIPST